MDNPFVILLLVGVPIGLFIAIWAAVAGGGRQAVLATRLANLQGAVFADDRAAELSKPFSQRVLGPIVDRLGVMAAQRTSAAQIAALETKLSLAGRRNMTPSSFMAMRILVAFGGLLLGAVLSLSLGLDPTMILLLVLGMGALGYVLSGTWLDRQIKGRRNDIRDAMPNALDLLTISTEAGLSFDAALTKVVEKYVNPLSDELGQVLNEIKLGRPRREALTAMADRVELDEMTGFVSAVVQSEQMGTGLAQTLRIQSEEMRRRRRQRAEEQGAKAPLKMLLPMVGCIFPTLFIVLLGPALLEVTGQKS
jgi:tight adherence protein C